MICGLSDLVTVGLTGRGSPRHNAVDDSERGNVDQRDRGSTNPESTNRAGGKGAALASLVQSGFPVPDGFILDADCFDANGLIDTFRDEANRRFVALVASAGAVAVRSSALAEDSAGASFAGEFESVLNVATTDEFDAAICEVQASASSERVRSYSEHLGEDTDHQIAIVVQEMVKADFAGVLFTVEPVSQNPQVLSGNFVSGLGEALVSGEVAANDFTIDRASGAYEGDVALADVATRLGELALDIEAHFGSPQDIEWAVASGDVSILQARPITTLVLQEPWNDSLKGDWLWTNTNVGEAMSTVMTPYTWSLVSHVFVSVFATPNAPFLGNIGGRAFMNLSTFFGLLGAIGIRPVAVLEGYREMLGDVPPDMTLPMQKVGLAKTLRWALGLLGRGALATLRLKRHLRWATDESSRYCEEYRGRVDSVDTYAGLMTMGDELRAKSVADFPVLLVATEVSHQSRRRLKSALEPHLRASHVETLVSGLSGGGTLESMGPMMAIARVARGEESREEFVRRYGHRGPSEMEAGLRPTSEDPAWIDKLIEQSRELDIDGLLVAQQAKRDAAWQRLAALVSPRRLASIRRKADAAITTGKNREIVRSEFVRLAGLSRALALRAGELTGLGDDIFMLEMLEIDALLGGDRAQESKIRNRRESYDHYNQMPMLPNFISGQFDVEAWYQDLRRRTDFHDSHRTLVAASEDVITGCPGAAGVVEGRVRVLGSHNDADQFETGEILVASFTNVGWTPIFPRALAVITDIGAPLSHAAIVARELGIPAVVGTGNATMVLKTGDKVRVDGSAGLVEPL